MKEKRVTKKAILASLLSVAVCTSMLIGTSYAWFTDSAVSTGNKIVSGKLSIDFMAKNTDGEYESVDGKAIYTYDRWEPGYVSWNNLKVTTDGNLALKYTLNFTSKGDIKNAKLAEAIDVYYAPGEIVKPEGDPTRPTTAQLLDAESNENTTDSGEKVKLRKLGTLKDAFAGNANFKMEDTLIPENAKPEPDEADTDDFATLVLVMREEAGNEYQNLTIPEFDVSIFATQYTYEIDTFDNQYDKDASVYKVSDEAGLTAALGLVQNGETIKLESGLALNDRIVVDNGKQFTLDLGGNTLSGGYTIKVVSGDLTIANGTVDAESYGVDIQTTNADEAAKVTIANDATVKGTYAVINREASGTSVCNNVVDIYGNVNGMVWMMGNIRSGNSVVNVYPGAVIDSAVDDVALAVQGAVTANVYGTVKCTYTATAGTGIEIRGGELNVYDGALVQGCGSPDSFVPNGNGTTTIGAGIGVSQHKTKLPITVNVSGGTIESYVPLLEVNPQNNADEFISQVTINVTGGTFTCTNGGTTQFSIYDEGKITYNNIYAN